MDVDGWLPDRVAVSLGKETLTHLQGRMCAPATVMGNWQKSYSGHPVCYHPRNNMSIPVYVLLLLRYFLDFVHCLN